MAVSTTSRRNGPLDNLFQRISNMAIVIYAFFMVGWMMTQTSITYDVWSGLFAATWFKVYSAVTLILACLNSLLAGWQIGGDYSKKVPFAWFEPLFNVTYFVVTGVCFVAGMYILIQF